MSRMLPFWIFLALVAVFAYRLLLVDEGNTPDLIPSVMVGKPAPRFELPPLLEGGKVFQTSDLKGKVTLVNFFASWCIPCRAEHKYLYALTDSGIVLVGVAYKNDPNDTRDWLENYGNPYTQLVVDREGITAIDFGVYGVPESYLIDKQGIIRFKQTGPITPYVIEKQLLPMIRELNK